MGRFDMSEEIDKEVQILSEVANKRRQLKANEIDKQGKPDFITDILQTETAFIINPSALPYKQANLNQFSDYLEKLYGLSFKQRQKRDEEQNPLEVIFGNNERSDVLIFENGKFKVSNRNFIPIQKVKLTTEQVHVILGGDSSISEAIIADLVEALWASTGINKTWADIDRNVQIKSYGTATKVDFGKPLEEFLNPDFRKLLNDEFIDGKGFGKHMIPYSSVHNFNVNNKTFASFVLDDLNLLFNLFNPTSGESYQAKLQFRVLAKHEYGSGKYVVISQLPYDLHVECLQMLKSKFA